MICLYHILNEILLIIFRDLLSDIAINQPKHSKEETDIDDENDQFQGFEAVVNHHEEFNLVVILIHVICELWVIPY